MEFDQYCQKLGIDLIPSISTFGHLYKLLETKTYAHLCELDGGESRPFSFLRRMRHHTLDASNPDSVKLMLAHIDEYMSLFTSKYFNICADETFDLGRGKSAAMTQELGREEVYIRFVKQLCDHVVSRGKIPMFWGDIIASRPEKISVLPKETICLNWGYDPNQSDETVKSLKTAGAVQYLCPGVQGWNDFINVMPDAYANISRMCRYAYTYDIPGVLNTDWGDCGHVSHPDFSAFGLICGAAFSWNREIPDYETICRQVSVVEYKDDTENIMQYISDISIQNVFRWLFIVLFKEMKQSLMADDPELEQGIKKLQSRAAESITEEKVRQANAAIMDGMDKLAVYLHRAPENVKQTINRLLNAAKGQMIFNEIALYIFRNCGDELCPAENSRCSGNELYMPENSRNCDDELCPPEKSCRCGEALCSPEKTAAALERWFMDYKRIWREYGKEGDLRHIQALVCWYGDYLRSL